MKGLAITSKGVEEAASVEIKELISAHCRIESGCVAFENFFEEFKTFIEKTGFDEWVDKSKKFKVECIREGKHDFNSVNVEGKAAGLIQNKFKNKKFDIKSYDILFLVYIVNDKCYFGVDFAGFEMNKRAYKIFLHSNSLRGTIAYALV